MDLNEFKQKFNSSASGGRSDPPRNPPPSSRRQPSSGGLPSGYLVQGYFDEKGNILPQVVKDWAYEIALRLDQEPPGMNASQLRKFFNEARHIQGQMQAGKSFDSLRGRVLKLDAYAADALKKGNVPQLFKRFIEENLKWAVKDRKNYLEGFVPHFESVVAYFPRKQ
jgi:CRISPR type III-A-associated protein Csm2